MSAEVTLSRLRVFLLGLTAALLVGALVELVFSEHTAEPVQIVPFILCALGLIAIATALLSPQRRSLLLLSITMGLVGIGSLFGMYEHIMNNIAFQLEIDPNLTLPQQIATGLGGANPLLAPAILGIAAILALASVYQHPLLSNQRGS
jgi:hypothetical protein